MIEIRSRKREEIIDITDRVKELVKGKNGLVVVYSPHTTTAVIINEAESGLLQDIISKINELVPKGAGYLHDRIDDNADSHIKASLFGNSVVIPVEDGRLMLGTWQRILFLEFDGPRTRRVFVKIYETEKG